MKKFVALLLALTMVFSLFACAESGEKDNAAQSGTAGQQSPDQQFAALWRAPN